MPLMIRNAMLVSMLLFPLQGAAGEPPVSAPASPDTQPASVDTAAIQPASSIQSASSDTVAAQPSSVDTTASQPSSSDASTTHPDATRAASAQSTSDSSADQTPPPNGPNVLSGTAAEAYDRHDAFPNVNLYLPEGQASIRLRKLIRNVLFESQIDYRFVNGDISTFLRYKYYARNFTYRLGVFDQIGFPDLGSHSNQEFQRVRGGLLLFEFPRDYDNRFFWLLQDDRLTFGIPNNPDNKRNNTYTKVAYEYGAQTDERLNAIAGESRGRIIPVLTAFRDLGPQRFSAAVAVTESGRVYKGDYKYTKVEGEAVKRWNTSTSTFLVQRLHAGAFLQKGTTSPVPQPADFDGDGTIDPVPQYAFYTVPQYELFALGGREALRSISDNLDTEGTDEVHLTNEFFVPLFRNRDIRTWGAHWNTLYAVAYAGAGGVGFHPGDVVRSTNRVVDAGLGAEAAVSIRDFEVILSVLYAHTVQAPDNLQHGRVIFSIHTIR